ncbi:MAG: transposase [Halobacteriovoraceae bacterium]|nr:transposase [Halobacteriovoraceae bacterium]MCB9093659.1 transposase [Halobacteriovoraceae bacterium]
MGRRKLIKTDEFPYHIVSRTNNKEWFALELEQVWRIVKDSLLYSYERCPFELIDFVLMNNHYHMLIKTPNANIDEIMFYFNSFLSKSLRLRTNRINRMFGGRYKWSIVDNETYLYTVTRYIFQNPIRAGISTDCNSYPFSTLFYKVNKLKFCIPLYSLFPTSNFSDHSFIDWLNSINDKRDNEIRRGLKQKYFNPCSTGPRKKIHHKNW